VPDLQNGVRAPPMTITRRFSLSVFMENLPGGVLQILPTRATPAAHRALDGGS